MEFSKGTLDFPSRMTLDSSKTVPSITLDFAGIALDFPTNAMDAPISQDYPILYAIR